MDIWCDSQIEEKVREEEKLLMDLVFGEYDIISSPEDSIHAASLENGQQQANSNLGNFARRTAGQFPDRRLFDMITQGFIQRPTSHDVRHAIKNATTPGDGNPHVTEDLWKRKPATQPSRAKTRTTQATPCSSRWRPLTHLADAHHGNPSLEIEDFDYRECGCCSSCYSILGYVRGVAWDDRRTCSGDGRFRRC